MSEDSLSKKLGFPEYVPVKPTLYARHPWKELNVGDSFVTIDHSYKRMKYSATQREKIDGRKYTVEELPVGMRVTRIA